jgi:hypothetical protein
MINTENEEVKTREAIDRINRLVRENPEYFDAPVLGLCLEAAAQKLEFLVKTHQLESVGAILTVGKMDKRDLRELPSSYAEARKLANRILERQKNDSKIFTTEITMSFERTPLEFDDELRNLHRTGEITWFEIICQARYPHYIIKFRTNEMDVSEIVAKIKQIAES